jgi:hypothetical protein
MLRNWSSGTWSKASGRATVELDQMRTRFLYRISFAHSTSGVTQEPPQGSFIWLFGAPEIRVSTENSESMQKSSDLSCLAVVSQACAHSSRAAFMARRLDESTVFVIDITKCRHIPVALRIAPNVVWVSRDRRRKSGPNLIQPNGGPSARL